MAMWAGAVMEPGPHVPMMHLTPYPLGVAYLTVNIKGARFHNEDVPGYAYSNAILRQPGRTAWQVFDSKYPEELSNMGIGLGKFTSVTDVAKEYPEMQYTLTREFVEKETVQADNIEELAEKMNVPAHSLRATVTRYNELARMGKDLDFGKRADRLTSIDRPPYYAGKDRGLTGFLCILGGLNVNDRMQALDKDFEPISGLYLAGNTIGNRFGCDYPTMVPGISHGMALHFGRIAGANAAKSTILERKR
jgi:fumarate reductase flavoprotein subunit